MRLPVLALSPRRARRLRRPRRWRPTPAAPRRPTAAPTRRRPAAPPRRPRPGQPVARLSVASPMRAGAPAHLGALRRARRRRRRRPRRRPAGPRQRRRSAVLARPASRPGSRSPWPGGPARSRPATTSCASTPTTAGTASCAASPVRRARPRCASARGAARSRRPRPTRRRRRRPRRRGVFPVAGAYSYGSPFGEPRKGYSHQGQTSPRPSARPSSLRWPARSGYTDYQASAAGYYVVLDADDGHAYFFAHCQKGSTAVSAGQAVARRRRDLPRRRTPATPPARTCTSRSGSGGWRVDKFSKPVDPHAESQGLGRVAQAALQRRALPDVRWRAAHAAPRPSHRPLPDPARRAARPAARTSPLCATGSARARRPSRRWPARPRGSAGSSRRPRARSRCFEGRVAAAQSDLDRAVAAAEQTARDLADARARVARLRKRLGEVRAQLGANLRERYMGDTPDLVTVVLSARGFNELLETVSFLKTIQRRNTELLALVRDARADAGREQAPAGGARQAPPRRGGRRAPPPRRAGLDRRRACAPAATRWPGRAPPGSPRSARCGRAARRRREGADEADRRARARARSCRGRAARGRSRGPSFSANQGGRTCRPTSPARRATTSSCPRPGAAWAARRPRPTWRRGPSRTASPRSCGPAAPARATGSAPRSSGII